MTFAVEKEAANDAEQVLLLGNSASGNPIELKKDEKREFKATLNLPMMVLPFRVLLPANCNPMVKLFMTTTGEADDYVPGPSGDNLWCGSASQVSRYPASGYKKARHWRAFHYLSSFSPTYRHNSESIS